jgi:hypothetical protein
LGVTLCVDKNFVGKFTFRNCRIFCDNILGDNFCNHKNKGGSMKTMRTSDKDYVRIVENRNLIFTDYVKLCVIDAWHDCRATPLYDDGLLKLTARVQYFYYTAKQELSLLNIAYAVVQHHNGADDVPDDIILDTIRDLEG